MRKLWTPSEIEYLKVNYPDKNTADICKELNRSFSSVFGMVGILGIHKSEAFRNSPLSGRLRPGSKIGGATRFQKGIIPITKGKKQSEYMSQEAIERTKATRFKKGQKPKNTKEADGTITVRTHKGRAYQFIRISLGKWIGLHLFVWEQHNGPVPKGFNVQFRDKNPMNCTIENLYLIDRKNQMVENTIHRYDPELKSLIRLTGKLKRKLKSYEKQN